MKSQNLKSFLIAFKDLDESPTLVSMLEKDWKLINSLSVDEFLFWAENADPIKLENYKMYAEYRNRKSKKTRNIIRNIFRSLKNVLNSKFGQATLDVLYKVAGAALVSFFIVVALFNLILVLILITWIGTQLYAFNVFLGLGYIAFMFVFIPAVIELLFINI
jgi:hypothetical protein